MKSYTARAKDITRNWLLIDAEGKSLGRVATEVATLLRGKHKPIFTPTIDTGDYVIVINADKVKLTGNKREQKMHRYHTRYPGGLKSIPYTRMMDEKPERVMELAVKGMLPKGPLGRQMAKKLRVYRGEEHGHDAQQPVLHEF
ncbi:MAG: 50S ribosomal protein L13 [Tissierellia bacterium]|jgi:large subunit ribosomal protein L13|nr:50S ribosomal protein L13 [Bacillota bacterium]NLK58915.1 50S ribosomal protein L13 [Tissierellia bacterium]